MNFRAVPQVCQSCGRVSPGGIRLGPGATLSLTNIVVSSPCSFCGSEAITTDGLYRWGDMLWDAIRQPGITREDIATFKGAVEEVLAGQSQTDETAQILERTSATFASLFKFLSDNEKALYILVSLLGLMLASAGLLVAIMAASGSHSDAQAQLRATERQTKVIATGGQASLTASQEQLKFGEQLAALNALGEAQKSNLERQRTTQEQMLIGASQPNRQQRRKTAQIARKRARKARALRPRTGF